MLQTLRLNISVTARFATLKSFLALLCNFNYFFLSNFLNFVSNQIVRPTKLAQDAGIIKKLWEVSETLVKLDSTEKYF